MELRRIGQKDVEAATENKKMADSHSQGDCQQVQSSVMFESKLPVTESDAKFPFHPQMSPMRGPHETEVEKGSIETHNS